MSQKVIVVGTGFGGLASAIRLRAMGYEVEMVEAGSQPGGRARVFKQDGFSFDAGPTVVTAPHLLEELFALVGRDYKDYFELMPVDPFYRVAFPDGETFDYVGDQDRLLAQIERFSPRDVEGYKKLVKKAQDIFEIGYEQLAHVPFNTVSDMLRVVPQMVRLKSYQSVYGMVASYIKDERLRQVFTFQPLLVGGNPFNVSSIYLLIHWLERKWGVHFAKGGTTSIVHGMVKLLEEIGVSIRYNSPVERLDVVNGQVKGVVLESGETIKATKVVSNADPSTVYSKWIDPKDRKKHTNRSVDRKRQSMSLFVAYFGTKKTYEDIAHHTIVLGPRYKGLLKDVFSKKVLADDFSLYLHAPTRSDPSVAPEGCENFYVLSPVPNQKSGLDWSELQDEYMDRILTHLDQNQLPGLKENLVTQKAIDPRYFQTEMRSHQGNAFGIEPVLQQSAYMRYHNVSEDVEGLFFVGAATHPGAGMPGVIGSAKVLEAVMPPPLKRQPIPHNKKIRLVS